MIRPSHDLETAARLSQTTLALGRARSRTQETHLLDLDDTSSSDDSTNHIHFRGDKDVIENDFDDKTNSTASADKTYQHQQSLFSRLLQTPKTPQHGSLVQRIDSDNEECESLVESNVRKPNGFRSNGSAELHVSHPVTHLEAAEVAISLPQPQRRPPSHRQVQAPAQLLPSVQNYTPVGSVGGAFTRYHPSVEGTPREFSFTTVNVQTRKAVQFPRRSQEACHAQSLDRGDSVEEGNTTLSDHALEDDGSSFIMSLPKMSAIAAASAACQHNSNRIKNGKKAAGSVRTGTETSSGSGGDDISLQTSARPPSSLTSPFSVDMAPPRRCGYRAKQWLNNTIPQWFRKAPVSIQVIIVFGFVMLFLVVTVIIVSILKAANENQEEGLRLGGHHTVTITDDEVFQETLAQWADTAGDVDDEPDSDLGAQRWLHLRNTPKL